MVSPAPPRTSSYDDDSSQADWPSQVADQIERAVGSVRDKTTGPLLTLAKVIVYGTFAGLVGLVALVLFVISAVRLLDSYLPDAWVGEEHTWVAHLIIGTLFVVIGGVLWIRRRAPEHMSRY